jgi:hypothetical protein
MGTRIARLVRNTSDNRHCAEEQISREIFRRSKKNDAPLVRRIFCQVPYCALFERRLAFNGQLLSIANFPEPTTER